MGEIRRIGVIGAGQMGGGIAQVAAVAGFETAVYDSLPASVERCRGLHEKLLARAIEKGRMTADEVTGTKARLTYVTNDAGGLEALRGSEVVIEAIVEDAAVKRELFAKLASMFVGDEILATNTSSISITEIGAAADAGAAGASSRVIGMHFFNPVPVMKLVEVIKGLATSDEVTSRTIGLAERMGKTAVPANDRAGFVSNRVLMPMINEAFHAWMEGVAEPEHIDEIMKLGMAHPMGPLRLADFIGLDTCVHIMDVLADGLNSERYRACPKLKQLVAAGRLGDKTGRGVFAYGRHEGEA